MKVHKINGVDIAEVISDDMIIKTIDDGIDVVGNTFSNGCDKVILHKDHIIPSFFDLKNRMAGEILQKFSTYRIQLVIVGDFSEYINQSKSLKDFIFESNKGRQVNFLSSTSQALERLAG